MRLFAYTSSRADCAPSLPSPSTRARLEGEGTQPVALQCLRYVKGYLAYLGATSDQQWMSPRSPEADAQAA